MNPYIEYLSNLISEKDSLKLVKTEAKKYILAMSFDNYCAKIGYEEALPVIKAWYQLF